MSYIQLPYGYVENNKQVQFNLPSNFKESFYLSKVPHLTRRDPTFENDLINIIKNRDDLKKWLLATSDFGDEIQDDINAVVGHDEKFTNAIVRHSLDLKDESIFRNQNSLNVTFHDMKKFDLVNPVIGKLTTQVKASKLNDYELTKKFLQKGEVDEIQQRLDRLKYGANKGDNNDDDNKPGPGGGSGGTSIPPKKQTIDELTQRLYHLRGNTEELSPDNTPEQNARIIMKKNNEKFLNRQINQREKELAKVPKGIVKNRRSTINFKQPDTWRSINFKLLDTPPSTPDNYWPDVDRNWIPGGTPSAPLSGPPTPSPSLFDYDRDFPPLSKFVPEPSPSRETTFLSDGTISSLRAKLPHIAPLPSKPALDNFSRLITKIVDESNNTISLTPKKPPIEPTG